MKAVLTTLALAALLCGCNATDDDRAAAGAAVDDATVGTPPPGDPNAASDQPPVPPIDDDLPGDDRDDDVSEVEVPERFRGEWAASAAACNQPGEVSRLYVGDDDIRFHESEGPIVSVSGSGDTATVEARLTGEGETRVASYTFTLSADGNTLTDSTNGFARVRCD